MLAYAGVALLDPFVSPWPEEIQSLAEHVEATMPLGRCFPLWERLTHSSRPRMQMSEEVPTRWIEEAATSFRNATGILEDTRLRLNTLVWPKGACRWSHFHTLVSGGKLASIRGAVGKSYVSKPLRMEWWSGELPKPKRIDFITTEMYMLPARPVGPDCHLLTLVDARYFWWKPVDITIEEGVTTWAGLIGACGLGGTIETVDDSGANSSSIRTEYLKPGLFYHGWHEHAPVLLDAVCHAVGLRVVRELDGSVKVQDSRRAVPLALANAAAGKRGYKTDLGGGVFAYKKPNDAICMVPETFVLDCMKILDATVQESALHYSKSVSLETLSNRVAPTARRIEEFKNITGNSFTETQRDSVIAWFTTSVSTTVPVNETEITELAERAAIDFWLYRRVIIDQRWSGIIEMTPEGHSDRYEWEYRSDGINTRIIPGDTTASMWGHLGTYTTPRLYKSWCATFGIGVQLAACLNERKAASDGGWCATFGIGIQLEACIQRSVALAVPGIFSVSGSPVTGAGTITVAYSGAQGDILYASSSSALSALAKDANATRYLSNTGSSNNPAWAQVNLANGVTGTLPVANGGTNSAAALNNNRIIVSSSGALVEAGAMTDGQLLIGDTGAAPVVAAITAGAGISVTNGAGSITIANTGLAGVSKVDGTGSTTNAYATIVVTTNSNGAPVWGTVKNTHGSFSLDLLFSLTDAFGNTDSPSSTVAPGGSVSFNSFGPMGVTPSTTCLPPYTTVSVQVKSTVAGDHATYSFQQSYF